MIKCSNNATTVQLLHNNAPGHAGCPTPKRKATTHRCVRSVKAFLANGRQQKNVKTDFTETRCGAVNWVFLIQDNIHRRILVKTAINPQVP